MDTEKFTHDFKAAVFNQMEKEILNEVNIPYCKWVSMKDIYAKVRSQIGVDNDAYYEALENMYTARKALDNMRF